MMCDWPRGRLGILSVRVDIKGASPSGIVFDIYSRWMHWCRFLGLEEWSDGSWFIVSCLSRSFTLCGRFLCCVYGAG